MQIIKAVSNTITRPSDTTAYASGDLIANSTTAGSVTPFTINIPGGTGLMIYRVNVRRSDTSVTNASFRVHFYNDSPTVANGDNGAWSGIAAGYQGFVDVVGTGQAFTDSAAAYGVYVNNSVFAPMMVLTDSDQKMYALLEARAAYTPTSAGTFTIEVIGQTYV